MIHLACGPSGWHAPLHLVLSVQGTALLGERRDDLSVPHHGRTVQGGLIPLQDDMEAGTGVSSPSHPLPSLQHRAPPTQSKLVTTKGKVGFAVWLVDNTAGGAILFSGNIKPTAEQPLAAERTSE